MPAPTPPRLIAGPYAMPECRVGDVLADIVRGEVVVRGMSDAPIQWPYSRRRADGVGGGGKRSVVLCGDLARALRVESAAAIGYHWGVSVQLVRQWRRALNVETHTAGSRAEFARRAGRRT